MLWETAKKIAADMLSGSFTPTTDAKNYTYALMDLNGDSIEELITCQPGSGQDTASLRIFTIQDGELKQYASDISYICAGGILEKCEEEQTDQGRDYGFYRCGANGPEFIEKIVRDPWRT